MHTRLAGVIIGAVRGIAAAAFVLLVAGPVLAESDLTGQILVAVPELRDPNFTRTVVYLLRHDQSGALGLVVNRPLGEVPVTVILQGKSADPAEGRRVLMLSGGPVNPRLLFSLHSNDFMADSSIAVDDQLAYTVERDVLRAVEAGKAPKRALFALGYSGWAPGQLENELERGDWFVIPGDSALVFDQDHQGKWERAVARFTPEL